MTLAIIRFRISSESSTEISPSTLGSVGKFSASRPRILNRLLPALRVTPVESSTSSAISLEASARTIS